MRGEMFRLPLHYFRVMALRLVPVFFFKVQMAEPALHFDHILATFESGFELTQSIIHLTRRSQCHGGGQTAGVCRALLLGWGRSRISAQQALDELVVDKENLLTVFLRYVLRHGGVSSISLRLFLLQRRDPEVAVQCGLLHSLAVQARAACRQPLICPLVHNLILYPGCEVVPHSLQADLVMSAQRHRNLQRRLGAWLIYPAYY